MGDVGIGVQRGSPAVPGQEFAGIVGAEEERGAPTRRYKHGLGGSVIALPRPNRGDRCGTAGRLRAAYGYQYFSIAPVDDSGGGGRGPVRALTRLVISAGPLVVWWPGKHGLIASR